MNLKKSIAGALTALAVATMAASPAAAGGSKSYCASKAKKVKAPVEAQADAPAAAEA